MKKTELFLSIFMLSVFIVFAQDNREKGLIVKNFGETFKVEHQDIKTDTSAEFKVIFDVSQSSADKSVVNKYIVTAARFLNMHASEGMKKEQLKVAMTIHGGAWQDVLNNEVYKEKYGVDNPNFKLINELTEAGADIIICGQTAGFRGITKDNANPNVKFALSAMTALLQYQSEGYTFIKF
ncbi:DsrE family protein [Pontimicrobium aquaticum]|uniref:Uncharacterized protein n=1 Tax=Pontimicrobium aquaticum TaxID=2565367 RepID=A0A4U0EVV2_9FLAO|nr:DsrE family protein [Pontimicrobium aquaticum]TJY36015.1 hypothetical protein E5167_09140 [Pontimicrobium aquaticum]